MSKYKISDEESCALNQIKDLIKKHDKVHFHAAIISEIMKLTSLTLINEASKELKRIESALPSVISILLRIEGATI